MLVFGDLGFSYMVLVCFFVPVIGFVVRHKWRLASARKEEIKRLLILASEESARAELEASVEYGSVTLVPQVSQCAVCYTPTSARCARCQAVRYCSGKCQIIHWRRGHKDECHPPPPALHINDEASESDWQAVKQERNETSHTSFDSVERPHPKSVETFIRESTTPNPRRSSKVRRGKDEKGANSPTTPLLAEFSDSTSTSESLVDDSSSEIDSSEGFRKSFEPTSNVKMDRTKAPSPQVTASVQSKLNVFKPGYDKDTQYASTYPKDSSVGVSDKRSVLVPSKASSGFSEGILDSSRLKNDAHGDTVCSHSLGTSDNMFSNSGSSFQFSFNLSGNSIPNPNFHAQGSESKADDGKARKEASLSEKVHADDGKARKEASLSDASQTRSSPSLISGRSNHVDDDSSSKLDRLKPREVKSLASSSSSYHLKSAEALKASSSPPVTPERRSNHVDTVKSESSHSKSKKVEPLAPSPGASDAHLFPISGGDSVPSEKFVKADHIHFVPATSPVNASSTMNASYGLRTSARKVVDQIRAAKLSKHYQSGVGNDISGRYSNKALFPYDFFVKLYNWNNVELRPAGLVNCGNSCYANAVLQCLAFTPPLTAYLLQGLHSKSCIKKDWCFACEFEKLILKAKEGNSPLSPIGILSQIRNIGSHLTNGREEDAHEFLRYAIDTMQSVCLKEAGVSASGFLEEETTLIGLTFGGYLRSKIKCLKCQGKSEQHERMMDLTVEIAGDIETLEEALRKFSSTEVLDGENKYHCSRCKSYEKAKKKLMVSDAPNILTIVLKRFQSGKFGKLNKSIRFPEILDLAPCMSGTSDKSPIYRLYGVVVHLDIMNAAFSGHYVCYVKNIQNKWFKIDDSMVEPVELDRVLNKGAYMLLYSRCSPRAPRSIRTTTNIPRDTKTKNKPMEAPFAKTRSQLISPIGKKLEPFPSWIPLNGPTATSRSHCTYGMDSSSDSSSLFSSNSDEGSCSTESNSTEGNRDSSSTTDDFSDYIFGSPWRNLSDSDTSSSSSSSSASLRLSPLADLERYASSADSAVDDLGGKGGIPFFCSDDNSSKQCRNLGTSFSNSSSGSSSDRGRLGGFKTSVSFRGSSRARTD